MKIETSILYFIASLTVACSSSSPSSGAPTPCNENPWECTAGQTCWPKTAAVFACLNSGGGKVGSACLDTVGVATCGDGLTCLQTGTSGGVCTQYCDNTDVSHACPSGQMCATASFVGGGPQFQICVAPGALTPDAGGGPANTVDSGGALPPPGAGSGDGGAAAVSAACTAWANHDVAQCPSDDPAATIAECTQGEALYIPEGCGSEWSAYVTCATTATYSSSCSDGPTSCDTQQNAYFACQSRFASSTSCSRVPDQDSKCGPTAPYGYGCLSTLPSGCVQLPATGGATLACCTMFPAQ
jgi:hypothetical protein